MGARFVVQPNGLLARFSEVVDDFTDYDMSDAEASALAVREGCSLAESHAKVGRAKQAGQARWDEAIDIIRKVHGAQYLASALVEMGLRQ